MYLLLTNILIEIWKKVEQVMKAFCSRVAFWRVSCCPNISMLRAVREPSSSRRFRPLHAPVYVSPRWTRRRRWLKPPIHRRSTPWTHLPRWPDPIHWLRHFHCPRPVQTNSQIIFHLKDLSIWNRWNYLTKTPTALLSPPFVFEDEQSVGLLHLEHSLTQFGQVRWSGSHGDAVAFGVDQSADLGQVAFTFSKEFNGRGFHHERVLAVGALHAFHTFHVALGEHVRFRRFHEFPHSLVSRNRRILSNPIRLINRRRCG